MSQNPRKTLLFLCTGNYYRSRFAEVLFNSVARKMGVGWNAASKGLDLKPGVNIGSMAAAAIQTLEAMGIGDAPCCARPPAAVTEEDFEKAHVIIALKEVEHLPLLQARFPQFVAKVEFWHIDDAPGVLPLIEGEIMNLVARFLGGGQKAPTPTREKEPVRSAAAAAAPAKRVVLKVGRETAGRRGKGVTTVFDTPLDEHALSELAAKLKQRCGTGGTVKAGRIEIQGDQRERVIKELESLGFGVKRVGG